MRKSFGIFRIVLSVEEEIYTIHNNLIEDVVAYIEKCINKKIYLKHALEESQIREDFIRRNNRTFMFWGKDDFNSDIPNVSFISFDLSSARDILEICYNWDIDNYSHNMYNYLYWLCLYHSLKIFLDKGILIQGINMFGSGDLDRLDIKTEEDIHTVFNGLFDLEFYKKRTLEVNKAYNIPYSLIQNIKKVSDIIPLLKVSYEEAKKMKIFPKEWEM